MLFCYHKLSSSLNVQVNGFDTTVISERPSISSRQEVEHSISSNFKVFLNADDLGFIGVCQEGMGHGHFDSVLIAVAVEGSRAMRNDLAVMQLV